jgi:outer membrane protein assembly factor BamB
LIAAEVLVNGEGEWSRRFVFGSVARAWLVSGLAGGCGLIAAILAARHSSRWFMPVTGAIAFFVLYYVLGIPDPGQFEGHISRLPELSLAFLGVLTGVMGHSRYRLWWGVGAALVAAAALAYGLYLQIGLDGISWLGHLRVRFGLGLIAGVVLGVVGYQSFGHPAGAYQPPGNQRSLRAPAGSVLLMTMVAVHFYGAHFLLPNMGIERLLVSVDLANGKLLWQQGYSSGQEPVGTANSYATPTPVTDGKRVYAYFGSAGVVAVDYRGNVEWINRSLPLDTTLGAASSPVMRDGLLYLVGDNEGQSYVTALDSSSGEAQWTTLRDSTQAFATPLLHSLSGEMQLLVLGGRRFAAYRPADGRELWSAPMGAGRQVPSITAEGETVYAGGTYSNSKLRAFHLPAGDTPSLLWQTDRKVVGYSSPLIAEGYIYTVTNEGVASCIDASSGQIEWRGRLAGNYTASPVMAGRRIYFLNTEGVVTVIGAGTDFKVLAENSIGESSVGSPAIAGNRILFRSVGHLWCFEAGE